MKKSFLILYTRTRDGGPMWIPRQEVARWSRRCSECGLVQQTERTRDKIEKIPEFSDRRY